MKKRILSICIFLFTLGLGFGESFAQVTTNKKIQFDSSATTRTIKEIVLANDSSSGVPFSAYLETDLNFASPAAGPVLNVVIPITTSAYKIGMELFIKSSASNTGPLYINLNNLGPVEIKKRDTISLVSNEIVAGQIVKVVYSGSYFVLQSATKLACPQGFVSANDVYCIEIAERTPALYLAAVNACYLINARLCTWGEWYYACQKTSLGLSNMVNNWEYIDDSSDHSNTINLVGNAGNCMKAFTNTISPTIGTFAYRCCYNK